MKSLATPLAAAWACAAACLALPGAASAEGDRIRPALIHPTVTIAADTLAPSRMSVEGDTFLFVNDAPRTARVIFDRRHAGDVECTGASSDTGRRAQFLVPAGARLECHAGEGELRYEVFRPNGDGRLVKDSGRVRVR